MSAGGLVVALVGAVVVEVFFGVVRYRDSLNNNRPYQDFTGYIPLYRPIGYMSVAEFLSGGERQWSKYFLFRYLPHVAALLLVAAVLQKHFGVKDVLPYLLVTTSVSVFTRNLIGLAKARYISERLLHLFNSLMVYLITLVIALFGNVASMAFIAPSIEGLFDNLWSSLAVAMLVVLYSQATNPNAKQYDKQARENARDNYVVNSYNMIHKRFNDVIEQACVTYACSRPILYAVLIYENMNRPQSLRRFENILVRLFRVRLTVGIAQVSSDKPLSDAESIKKAARILQGSVFADSGYGSGFVDIQQLEGVLEPYNNSALYAESIAEIMSVLRRYSSDVFPYPAYDAVG